MIRHAKIAARMWLVNNTNSSHGVYRLSEELPYGDAIEKTWFVMVASNSYTNETTVHPYVEWVIQPVIHCAGGSSPPPHAEALDALGYELIEEET